MCSHRAHYCDSPHATHSSSKILWFIVCIIYIASVPYSYFWIKLTIMETKREFHPVFCIDPSQNGNARKLLEMVMVFIGINRSIKSNNFLFIAHFRRRPICVTTCSSKYSVTSMWMICIALRNAIAVSVFLLKLRSSMAKQMENWPVPDWKSVVYLFSLHLPNISWTMRRPATFGPI